MMYDLDDGRLADGSFRSFGKLPGRPSELIRLALAELKKIEPNPDYVIDMNLWHYAEGDKCYVCLAGAVMAGVLGAKKTEDLWFEHFPEEMPALKALDAFRLGAIEAALLVLGLRIPALKEKFGTTLPLEMSICPYQAPAEDFHEDMENLAKAFERIGL